MAVLSFISNSSATKAASSARIERDNVQKAEVQLSTGKVIPSDDLVAYSLANGLDSRIKVLAQANKNGAQSVAVANEVIATLTKVDEKLSDNEAQAAAVITFTASQKERDVADIGFQTEVASLSSLLDSCPHLSGEKPNQRPAVAAGVAPKAASVKNIVPQTGTAYFDPLFIDAPNCAGCIDGKVIAFEVNSNPVTPANFDFKMILSGMSFSSPNGTGVYEAKDVVVSAATAKSISLTNPKTGAVITIKTAAIAFTNPKAVEDTGRAMLGLGTPFPAQIQTAEAPFPATNPPLVSVASNAEPGLWFISVYKPNNGTATRMLLTNGCVGIDRPASTTPLTIGGVTVTFPASPTAQGTYGVLVTNIKRLESQTGQTYENLSILLLDRMTSLSLGLLGINVKSVDSGKEACDRLAGARTILGRAIATAYAIKKQLETVTSMSEINLADQETSLSVLRDCDVGKTAQYYFSSLKRFSTALDILAPSFSLQNLLTNLITRLAQLLQA